ncbi:MAG: hypothetical protein ACRDV2_00910, partial [Actinomycetes bacterium]
MRSTLSTARRFAAVAAVVPLAVLGSFALPASAQYDEGEWCEGAEVTKTVTDKSPRTVTGTSKDDVVLFKDPGHVVYLLDGNDYVCGSEGGD